MKIILSGASGTGKTTLMQSLSSRLNVDILNIPTTKYLSKYQIKSQDDLVKKGIENPEIVAEFYHEMITERCSLIEYNDNFITDRSPLDSIQYYLLQHVYFNRNCENLIKLLITKSIDILNENVYIIVLPIAEDFNQNNGIRTLNNGYNKYYQISLLHLYDDLRIKYLYCESLPKDMDERINELEFFINKKITGRIGIIS